MSWYYNLKISAKLFIGFFIVALIAGAVGIVGIVNIRSTDQKYSDLYEQYGIALGDIGNASTDFQITRNLTRSIIIEKGNDSAGNLDKIKQYDKEIDDYLAAFQKNIKTQEVQNEFNNLKTLLEKYRPIRDRITNLAVTNHVEQAIVLMNSDGAPVANSIEQSIKKLVDSKTTIGRQKSNEYSNSTNDTVVLMIIIILIAMIAAVALGIFISRIINK
ncbi:MAG TPA: MCP four helix bundle domain-containing protein, partial [Clostridia bacterium]